MIPFHGEFGGLQTLVSESGYEGRWSEGRSKKIFRGEDIAIFN